jgi:hypothetical protein
LQSRKWNYQVIKIDKPKQEPILPVILYDDAKKNRIFSGKNFAEANRSQIVPAKILLRQTGARSFRQKFC